MKNLRTIALCVSITLYSLCSSAQIAGSIPINEPDMNKPELFHGLPDNIPVNMPAVTGLFGTSVDNQVSVSLSSNAPFQFEGKVVSSVSKYNNSIVSVVIRSSNYPGAVLALSKLTDANGNVSYTGRIVSKQHADLYEMQEIGGQFFLVKKNYYKLINE